MVVPILALLALGVWQGLKFLSSTPDDPLRVAVLEPMLSIDDASIDPVLVEANVHEALLRGLVACDGVVPANTDEVLSVEGGPTQVAAALAVDEIVRTNVVDQGAVWAITIHRIDGDNGSIMRTRQFTAPKHEPLQIANAVHDNLRQTYPEFDRRKGMPALQVSAQDYERYNEIRGGFHSGRTDDASMRVYVQGLESITSSSPSFVEAHNLQSVISRHEFASTQETEALERSLAASSRAHQLAPGDPRPLGNMFESYIAANRLDDASASLEELADLNSDEADIWARQAVLARQRQNPSEALSLMEQAAESQPSRTNLFNLADLEQRQNLMGRARQHFDDILEIDPRHSFARYRLAQIELESGSLPRAEALYTELIEAGGEDASDYSNRGTSRLLQQRYGDARNDFDRARELQPDNYRTVLYLADCESALGLIDSAIQRYAAAMVLIDAQSGDPDWRIRSAQARCLAHLSRHAEATAAAEEALRDSEGNAEAHYDASLVYTVIGQRVSAIAHADQALALGHDRRWYGLHWFDEIRTDPALARRLSESGP